MAHFLSLFFTIIWVLVTVLSTDLSFARKPLTPLAFHTQEVLDDVSLLLILQYHRTGKGTVCRPPQRFRLLTKMSTVKQLSLSYDAINEINTFTNGDVINGRVIFEVTKEVTIESLYVKCKGEAKVSWSENHNDRTQHYSDRERYFKLKQYFIQDPSKKGKALLLVLLTLTIHIKTVY